MLVLGLILILLAVAMLIGVILGGSDDSARFDAGFLDMTVPTMAMFMAGAAAMLLLIVGFSLVRSGADRANQRRKDSKELSRLNKKLGKQEAKTEATDRELTEQRRRDDGPSSPSSSTRPPA